MLLSGWASGTLHWKKKRHLGSRRSAHTCNNTPGAGSIGGHARHVAGGLLAGWLHLLPITVASHALSVGTLSQNQSPPARRTNRLIQGWLLYHERVLAGAGPRGHPESGILTFAFFFCWFGRGGGLRGLLERAQETASTPSRRSNGCGVRFRGPRGDRSDLQRPCVERTDRPTCHALPCRLKL